MRASHDHDHDNSIALPRPAPLERAHALVRSVAAHLDGDRFLAYDIEAVKPLVASGAFSAFVDA